MTRLLVVASLLAMALTGHAVEPAADELGVTVAVAAGTVALDQQGAIWLLSIDGGAARRVTPLNQFTRDPALSPDGSRLAWAARESADAPWEIWWRELPEGEPQRLTLDSYSNRQPVWSPDGRSLAFVSDRTGTTSIWEFDFPGNALYQRSFYPGNCDHPGWASAGRAITFRAVGGPQPGIYRRDRHTGKRDLLLAGRGLTSPSVRPDSSVVTWFERDGNQWELQMSVLSVPAVTKPIARVSGVGVSPLVWTDRMRYYYRTGDVIRTREFGTREDWVLSYFLLQP